MSLLNSLFHLFPLFLDSLKSSESFPLVVLSPFSELLLRWGIEHKCVSLTEEPVGVLVFKPLPELLTHEPEHHIVFLSLFKEQLSLVILTDGPAVQILVMVPDDLEQLHVPFEVLVLTSER